MLFLKNRLRLPPAIQRPFIKIKSWCAKFPIHWVLAILVVIHGYFLLRATLPQVYHLLKDPSSAWPTFQNIHALLDSALIGVLLRIILGAGVIFNAIGLALRARIAWFMSLFLLICNLTYNLVEHSTITSISSVNGYIVILILSLVVYGRRFNQSSVLSGSIFAAIGLSLLLVYATFGVLYLGKEYAPPITNISDAFYFSIVAMSTVGFGDIVPISSSSRLFTTSIVIFGITIFATSISAIAGPILRGRLQHLVKNNKSMRKNHIIITGSTALATSVYSALKQAGHDIVVILPDDSSHSYPAETTILIGDATDPAVLTQANVAHASYVLALQNDDSENAFIVLAAREASDTKARTVALVNTPVHLSKIKQIKPDVILSLQSLGAEILSRLISDEPITPELISTLLFPLEKPTDSPRSI